MKRLRQDDMPVEMKWIDFKCSNYRFEMASIIKYFEAAVVSISSSRVIIKTESMKATDAIIGFDT